MKILKISIIILFLTSCNAVKVSYDYDNQTDFSAYTTYNYYDNLATGLSELDEKRLLDAMDEVLGEKGFKLSEEPDILVNIKSDVYQTQAGNNVGVGLGGGGGSLGGGVSLGIPVGGPKLSRELQVDFVDANKDMLIWQALSKSPFREGGTPMERQEKLQQLVAKIFSKYPPN